MANNPFKTSGPEVEYIVSGARCCRIWPVVTSTLTLTEGIDSWKHELWWWRRCGLCGMEPVPVGDR